MLAGILAIIRIIPAIEGLFQQLFFLYVKLHAESLKEEFRQGLRKALDEKDQRDLEKSLGSILAGKPSGNPGAIIVNAPPPGTIKLSESQGDSSANLAPERN